MTEHFSGQSEFERDDLVKLLQELQSRKDVLEKALSSWREKYSDIACSDEFDFSVIFSSIPSEALNFGYKDAQNPPDTAQEKSEPTDLMDRSTSGCFDQFFASAPRNKDEDNEDQYFEVLSPHPSDAHQEQDSSLQELFESLRESNEKVSSKYTEFEETISDIGKAAAESCSLRERASMLHRSLTLIEMRQEKGMREALFENVTANCTIRRLHDEIIQLRIRDAQHQTDIQRLMAENNRLKFKLMQTGVRVPPSPNSGNRLSRSSSKEEGRAANFSESPVLPAKLSGGLLEVDDLKNPICGRAIQRGSLSLYRDRINQKTVCVSSDVTTPGSFERKRSSCPLCNRTPEEAAFDSFVEEKNTRTVGTSTADIENIVALRTSIVVMGMVLPIPLFLACVLRTLEESMALIGRVCFAELPPLDPSFPEIQGDVLDSLKEMYLRVKRNMR